MPRYHARKFALVVVAVVRLRKIMDKKETVIKQEQQDEIRVRLRVALKWHFSCSFS